MTNDIFFLEPIFVPKLWGGRRMAEHFGYDIPSEGIGECWAASAHPDGDVVVKNGTNEGRTLSWLWENRPDIFGNIVKDSEPISDKNVISKFPLLTKIIDTKLPCSIQVHPDNHWASVHKVGDLGKSECWYVLDCDKGAAIILGHNAKTLDELKELLSRDDIYSLVHAVSVKPGDFIQVEPGVLHTIGAGILILETQQNSNVTYRIHDYRRTERGLPRELHKDKGLDVIAVPGTPAANLVKSVRDMPFNQLNVFIECEEYKVYQAKVRDEMLLKQRFPFLIGTVVRGSGHIDKTPVQAGEHFILPAYADEYSLGGYMEIIFSTVG